MISRRGFLTGLLAAPAIVRYSSLMIIKPAPLIIPPFMPSFLQSFVDPEVFDILRFGAVRQIVDDGRKPDS